MLTAAIPSSIAARALWLLRRLSSCCTALRLLLRRLSACTTLWLLWRLSPCCRRRAPLALFIIILFGAAAAVAVEASVVGVAVAAILFVCCGFGCGCDGVELAVRGVPAVVLVVGKRSSLNNSRIASRRLTPSSPIMSAFINGRPSQPASST